jgi:hypothetical protein
LEALDRPFLSGAIAIPTLVASTTWSRFPLLESHLPMIDSDSPPTFPGAQLE